MCGITGYVGNGSSRSAVLDGLSKLEYRGYDSAGFACLDAKHGHFSFLKEAGGVSPVSRLMETIKFDGQIGIGHTRWATHGIVDQNNAHPHFNCKKTVAVVHNGIIEGHELIRQRLLDEGHVFSSTTDTEVVAHLFGDILDQCQDVKLSLISLFQQLKGAYALLLLSEKFPDTLIVARKRSPMVLGVGDNEALAASDFVAFSDRTSQVIFMPDESFALITKNSIELFSFSGKPLPYIIQTVDKTNFAINKDGFEHYMLKEIYEQKRAIIRSIGFCKLLGSCTKSPGDLEESHQWHQMPCEYNDVIWRQLGMTKESVKSLRYINLIAAGTSWHAARIAQFFFEEIAHIPTRVYLASEFRYMRLFPEPHSVYMLISQSGETADTMEAMRLINSFEQHTIAITNVASSSMVREATGFLPMQAGPEISVASTKAFSTQVSILFWLAHRIALEQGSISSEKMHDAEQNLLFAAEILEATIEMYKFDIIKTLAPRYSKYEKFIFLGRHVSYPFALEAALKLKEISYIFAQCYPAGELKHGPIALVDEKTPVVLFSILNDVVYTKLVSNAQEVKARKGHLIVFAFEGQTELIKLADHAFIIPQVHPLLTPLAQTGLMQFFVYEITRLLGNPIDKPRNLAKSVTVE